LPCYLEGTVPAALAAGGTEADPGSAWWRMRELLTLVEGDFPTRAPRVRAAWDAFESVLVVDAAAVEAEATSARRAGRGDAASSLLSAFMARAVDEFLRRLDTLLAELSA